MPLCLGSVLCTHSPIVLHCALVSVWPTSSSASAQRGPMGPRKRPPRQPASLLHWGVSQSVSSQYHSVTAPAGRSSSSKSQNRLSIRPPRAHTLEVRLGPVSGANTGFRSDSSYLFAISALLSVFFSAAAPQAGGPGLLEGECGGNCKHMCVTYVWNGPGTVHIPSASGLTDKAHFRLHKMQRVVWWNNN